MTKDQKPAKNTPGQSTGSPNLVPTISSTVSVKDSVTLIAKPHVACSPGLTGNQGEPPCQKLREECPASTSSTSSTTRVTKDRCPVSGRRIPSVEQIAESLKGSVRVTPNWPWSIEETAIKIAVNLRDWALKYGLDVAAHMGRVVFEQPLMNLRLEGDQVNGDDAKRGSGQCGDGDRSILQGDRPLSESDARGVTCGESSGGSATKKCVGGSGEGGRVFAIHPRRDRSRGNSGISRTALVEEMEETSEDIRAFKRAHDVIHARVIEDEERLLKLAQWSGTSAVMGALDLSIHAMERTYDEMADILKRIDRGDIPNADES